MPRPVRLIFCSNRRFGTGQRFCVGSVNLDYLSQMRASIATEKLAVDVVKRECLGIREPGQVMRFSPGGRIFSAIDTATSPVIIDALKFFIATRRDNRA